MVNFDLLEKGLEIVFPPHLKYDFFKRNVSHVKLYKLTKFHCLSLVVEILVNMCIPIVNQVVTSHILKLSLSF